MSGQTGRSVIADLCHIPNPEAIGVEDFFTVVNYDQRASGKSAPTASGDLDLTIGRYVEDLGELIEWLRGELDVTKVGALGHSWGIIGVTLAHRRPELLWTYRGQSGDLRPGERGRELPFRAAQRHGRWEPRGCRAAARAR